jgi:hypothetical protein
VLLGQPPNDRSKRLLGPPPLVEKRLELALQLIAE